MWSVFPFALRTDIRHYDNYTLVSDITEGKYDDFYVYGVGMIDVEFPLDAYLAEVVLEWPVQECIEIEGVKYLLAHAMTTHPHKAYRDDYYMWGEGDEQEFLKNGIDGYISVCGHQNQGGGSIWKNRIGNVYICDCGSGDKNGRLGCLCLETKEEIYV